MTRLLDLTELSHELKTPPERIEELARSCRLPFSFSATKGLHIDRKDLDQWRSAVAQECDE
jgi:hypothetical protein